MLQACFRKRMSDLGLSSAIVGLALASSDSSCLARRTRSWIIWQFFLMEMSLWCTQSTMVTALMFQKSSLWQEMQKCPRIRFRKSEFT